MLQRELVTHAFTRWITPRHFQSRIITLQIEGEDGIHELRINSPTTVRDLTMAEKHLAGWGQYVVVRHQGQRLHPEAQLLPGVLYTIQLHAAKQVRTFQTGLPILGGGPAALSDQLGDRLLWIFMQALIASQHQMQQSAKSFVLYPFQVRQFLQLTIPDEIRRSWQERRHKEQGDIFLICELHGHWILVHGRWNCRSHGLEWTLHDGLHMQQALPWIHQVIVKLSCILGERCLGIRPGDSLQQHHKHTCGTLALVHMARRLSLLDMDSDVDIQHIHGMLLALQTMPSQLYAGGADDLQRQLADILTSKGVSTAAVEDRVKLVLQRIGTQKLQAILKGRNPWAELKAAASKPGSMFRLVTADEQKSYVEERAKTKHGAKINNHKSKKQPKGKSMAAPVQLDPAHFELNPHHFKDENDLPVPQINYCDVETEARGVALCTVEMAYQFLTEPCTISTDALALLLLDSKDPDMIEQAGLKPIVFPAMYKGTEEHTLIYGHILQLGDSTVSRESASKNSSPDVIDTRVLKLQVYRDQLALDWHRFAEAPIRALVSAMESLQLCKGASCGAHCGKFHPGLDETIENVIFELWARSFFDEQGHKTSPEKACLFTVFLRVPDGALTKILTSTPAGVYAEPRGSQPREQDQNYKVVWLPGASADEADHRCRTCDKAVCLVRLRNKYGVRVKKADEQAAWAHLRPGIDFMAMEIQMIFELFPIPHGTQRHAIAKLLNDWEWTARPLHPGKGSFNHMAWRVGAQTQPPQNVMTGFDNDVVITQIRELKQHAPQQQLIASTKTQRQLRSNPKPTTTSKSNTDPWWETGKDPWNPLNKPLPVQPNEGRTRLHELQDKLSKDITDQAQAAVKAAAASSHATAGQQESRIQALEVGLQELKGHNVQFKQWFQQAGERLQQTENTMGAMQQTLNSHQHELHALGSTFQSTMKTVKEDLSTEMNESFNKQLSRLEALLEKKQRNA